MSACLLPEQYDKLRKQLENGEITSNEIGKMLPEEKQAVKAILESFVTKKLGVKVSSKEVEEINKRAMVIDEKYAAVGQDLGNPSKTKEIVEFFKAKKDMENYLKSQAPSNRLKVLTGTIGRGMMLFSVKSPVLNIGSNVEIGLAEALSRRLSGYGLRGANNKLATDYMKMVNEVYQKTGYDLSRMTALDDLGQSGGRVLGETVHSQGKGAVRKVGRVIEDIVFKQLMGAPDVAFGAAHFADSVNLNSMKIESDMKPKEIMADAMRLEPLTAEGKIVRAQGIMDAQKATWTDTSWASRVSEGIRKILNQVSGDVRAGDYLLPFIKTPANVIATGMDYAGMGIPKAFFKTYTAFKNGNLGDKQNMQGIARDLVRSGFGLVGAALIAGMLDDDDFVGAYDPKRAQIESLRNSNYNAIRVGNKWISTDWLGPLAISVNAMMYARKYGKTGGERTFQYSKSVLSSAMNIPGVSDIYDSAKTYAYKKNQSLEEMTGSAADYISSEIYSRLIPSFMSDMAKAVDPKVRVSTKGWESIKSKIPFLSTTLRAKTNIFGEEIDGEPGLSDILFGARIKTSKENGLIKEISTVSENTDKGITFTDWDKSSSKQLAQFKDKVGEKKYNEAKIKYGQELKKLLLAETSKSTYKKLSGEDKLKIINNQDTQAINATFKKYGFKYKQKK